LTNILQPDWIELLSEIDQLCKKNRTIFLKIEPDSWRAQINGSKTSIRNNLPGDTFALNETPAGFNLSPHSIQPPRTILVDLVGSEEEILNRMKQKTRYNIRLAQRSGITITSSDKITLFSKMMEETSARDHFGVHSYGYYQNFYDLFHPLGDCELLLASFQEEPLAMLMVICIGSRAWYLYGASRSAHREKMPTYLLQWEAIRWAIKRQCISYDLWGVPDEEEETLEANFSNRHTGLWGVYRFKRGFGGTLLRSAGPWDRVYNSVLYRLYHHWMNQFTRRE
jgi:lipid II:glycine glycyltransferase (peptidoglycan interpeptide bridge formation enzyme)